MEESTVRIAISSHPRITLEAEKLGGKPCIRGLRISVQDVLSSLASGMTESEILEEFPDLEREDFQAVYKFAAEVAGNRFTG
jgi:uncharacterized protein (DUF433 family)